MPTNQNSAPVGASSGDASRLREALVGIKTGLSGKMAQLPTLMTPHEMAVLKRCEAALAAPPRNCDVGTAEEQAERYENFCRRYQKCTECPCASCRAPINSNCEFVWAQMPYEEGGAK